jgi:hypothetical protein
MIITDMSINSIDRLGHYEVGNQRFLHKQIAMFEAKRVGQKLKFYFNDDVFDQYDWTTEPEPEVGIGEFYRRRAQQLRDTNDYLVLSYSGGPDSQNILDTFLKHNIKLDEIVNFNSYKSTGVVRNTVHNADYYHNVKPRVDDILNRYGTSKMRVTILDEVEMLGTIWKEFRKRDDYEILFGANSFPSAPLYRGFWIKHTKHIWNMILDGKKVCAIYGTDKPTLRIDNGKYSMGFNDILSCDTAGMIMADPDLKGRNFLEFFYHSPDDVKLIIKQAHVLKRYVEKLNSPDYFEPREPYFKMGHRPHVFCESKNYQGNLKYKYFHETVYPDWKPSVITPKEGFLGNRPLDNWWVDDMDKSVSSIWKHGSVETFNKFSDLLKVGIRGFTGIPLTMSKFYHLEA